ncbi:MAG: MFS transporter [Acidimicrobiales bacterium]
MDRRSIAALLTAIFCNAAGSVALVTILGKVVYDLTGSVFDLGLLGLVEFAPAALLVFVVGAVADRFDRRRVVALGSAGSAITALALGVYVGTRPTSVLPIFVLVLINGTFHAFATPALRSLPADLVEPERLPWLVARDSASWQAAIIVGPVLGGLLYVADVRLPFVAAAGLFGLAGFAATLTAVRTHHVEPDEKASLHDAFEGLRFVRSQPVLLGAISLDLFAVLFGGAVALLPAIAEDRLGVGAVGLGWLRAAGGLGAALTTMTLAFRPLRRRVGRVLLTVVATFGVFTILLGVTRNYAVAFVALLVLSAADAVSVFIRATLVPLVTPPDKRGRVLAVENVFIGASNELGGFESGTAAGVLGTAGSVVLGGVATLVVALTWWRLFPALREIDGFPAGASLPEKVTDIPGV